MVLKGYGEVCSLNVVHIMEEEIKMMPYLFGMKSLVRCEFQIYMNISWLEDSRKAMFLRQDCINREKMKIVVSWWHVVNSDRQIKCVRSLITQHLLDSQLCVLGFLLSHPSILFFFQS